MIQILAQGPKSKRVQVQVFSKAVSYSQNTRSKVYQNAVKFVSENRTKEQFDAAVEADESLVKRVERNSEENNPFYGKHHSSESVQKRLDHWKPLRGKEHPTSRAVYQYTIDGVLVRMWESLNEIEQSLHLLKTNICKCCRGKRNVQRQ